MKNIINNLKTIFMLIRFSPGDFEELNNIDEQIKDALRHQKFSIKIPKPQSRKVEQYLYHEYFIIEVDNDMLLIKFL